MKRMKRMGLALAVSALVTWPALADQQSFLKEVDDLPLAPGLVEQPGGTLFDSPQGRIVEANAQGRVLEVEVRQFYDESLPQLGWQLIGDSVYRRDKEILRLGFSEGMPMVVHFSLTPVKSAAGDKDSKDTKEKGDKP